MQTFFQINQFRTLVSVLLLLTIVACSPSGQGGEVSTTDNTETGTETDIDVENTEVENSSENALVNTDWNLTSLAGEDVTGQGLTARFTENEVSGSDGCNSFGAGYTMTDGQINLAINNFFMTEMACMGDGVMERATQYTTALLTAGTFTIANNQLTIQTDSGELVYTAPVPAKLEGTQWQLSGLADGNDAVVHMAIDEAIYFQIEDDMVSGNSGCNSFSGNITLDGDSLSFGELALTKRACTNDDAMTRENEFLAMLAQVSSYQITRQSLSLYDSNGEFLASLTVGEEPNDMTSEEGMEGNEEIVEETAVNLSQNRWTLLHTVVGGDAIVPTPINSYIYMEFTDGVVTGNAGCNNFNGSVTIDGNKLSFGPLATTRIACEDEISSYEFAFLELLKNVHQFSADELAGTLAVLNADGMLLAEFAPSTIQTLFVGSEQKECTGEAPQMCLLVKEEANAEYEYFYDSIIGFDWQEGYEYELLVSITEIPQPLVPMDASSLSYALVELVSQTAVNNDNASKTTNSPLVGVTWQWTAFESPSGLAEDDITVEDPSRYTITFMGDGTYTLQNDCNTGSGAYTDEGGILTISPAATTLIACSADSLDGVFGTRLLETATYVLQEDGTLYLNLMYDSGNIILTAVE